MPIFAQKGLPIRQEGQAAEALKAAEIITSLGRLYQDRCYVCHKKIKSKGFTIHHLYYITNDVKFADYANRNLYYQALEPLVRKDPHRFMLLCNAHHQSLERLKRFKPENFNRLVSAVRQSR